MDTEDGQFFIKVRRQPHILGTLCYENTGLIFSRTWLTLFGRTRKLWQTLYNYDASRLPSMALPIVYLDPLEGQQLPLLQQVHTLPPPHLQLRHRAHSLQLFPSHT